MRTAEDGHAMVWQLLRVWTGIGLQSFGGGASTQLLIRRQFVDKRAWITADELVRFWTLCQFTPGINLIALTILIGRTLGGAWGIVASLAGMLLPSAAVTCALAVGFAAVQQSPGVHAVVHGVIPATAGIMAVVGLSFSGPPIARARREGRRALAISSALILGSLLALSLFKLPVFLVLLACALLGVLLFTPASTPAATQPAQALAHRDDPS